LQGRTVAGCAKAALRRTVANLVGNALRYGCEVGIGSRGEARAVVLRAVVLRIADRGPCLAAEQLEKVFQPFYRGESSGNRASGVTGLCLFIARDLCRWVAASLTLANLRTCELANRDGGALLSEARLPGR